MSQQPYDMSIKALLKEDAASIVPRLLPGAIFIDALDIEVLRSAMRADRVYHIHYRGQPHILHLEFQAAADEKIANRLLIYHAGLWRDYQQPVISMIVYLFRAKVAVSPLREISGNDEILTFHFSVLELWTLDAQYYLQEHAVSMYALLPAMKNANASVLLQAIDELIQYYKYSQSKLAQRLLWFRTFLQRADTVSRDDKRKVEERLDTFEQILEQSEYVQKQIARGEKIGFAKGKQEGKQEGEAQTAQQYLVDIVSWRYPALAELARQRASRTTQLEVLREIAKQVVLAPDEATARSILTTEPSV